jgi:hypothetical protein
VRGEQPPFVVVRSAIPASEQLRDRIYAPGLAAIDDAAIVGVR